MTAQQQEPTMREECEYGHTLAHHEAVGACTRPSMDARVAAHAAYPDPTRTAVRIAFERGWDAATAVLGQRGDDDAARVQLCPKCNGQGTVAKPPWIPGDVHQWSSGTLSPHRCNLCDGRMVIALDGDDTGSGQ